MDFGVGSLGLVGFRTDSRKLAELCQHPTTLNALLVLIQNAFCQPEARKFEEWHGLNPEVLQEWGSDQICSAWRTVPYRRNGERQARNPKMGGHWQTLNTERHKHICE